MCRNIECIVLHSTAISDEIIQNFKCSRVSGVCQPLHLRFSNSITTQRSTEYRIKLQFCHPDIHFCSPFKISNIGKCFVEIIHLNFTVPKHVPYYSFQAHLNNCLTARQCKPFTYRHFREQEGCLLVVY